MRYSIIVPHCHGAVESKLQRRELEAELRRLDRCELLARFSGCPTIEHAMVAGLRAARGETICVIEPGDRYPAAQLPAFLKALARADFVCGRRRRRGWPKLFERLGRLPRWLFLGLDVRDPGCFFWAARREAFNGLPLVPRFVRYLPSLVARQGYRVDSLYVEERREAAELRGEPPATIALPHVAPVNLVTAWWECHKLRRQERAAISEQRESAEQTIAGPTRTPRATSPDRYQAKSA
jgi:hypothetical protein